MGGKPSPGTPADKRLKANRTAPKAAPGKMPFKGAAPPFGAKRGK